LGFGRFCVTTGTSGDALFAIVAAFSNKTAETHGGIA
jgi:hypothetical protein